MKAFRGFCITFVITVLVAAGVAYYLWKNADELPEGSLVKKAGETMQAKPVELNARTPSDYHILESQGGIPLAEAERAGLSGVGYAYLRGLASTLKSEGVSDSGAVVVRGKTYELGYQFATIPEHEQYLEYNLGAAWEELHFGFGFADSHPSDPTDKLAIELEIKADGQTVLAPSTFKPTTDPLFASVDVRGVNRITIIVRRIGMANTFTPLLLDPFVRTSTAGSEESKKAVVDPASENGRISNKVDVLSHTRNGTGK